ncbi:MAG: hypothetical protein ACI9RZ_002576, partial [Sphingobacteriales bacterium]
LTRPELQEIVVLTSKIRTRLGMILTSKGDHLFSSFGIIVVERVLVYEWAKLCLC